MSLKPEIFGKFILLDKIAMGGMAEVYRAKAPGAEGIGKIVAIKRILPQYTANSEFIEMFKGEAKIAVNIAQANVGQIYEFGEEDSQFYLIMEFIDGRNLRQILSRCSKLQKALTIEQCVFILAQVANGLDYAHRCTDKNTGSSLNIIHRDMSPQNIMISFEGEVKIIDFGIAKAESKIDNTRAGTLKGKFGYMSPEQAEGLELDARTDIFSTGIVLWELLSGERLFVANNEVNTIRKIRECQIPSLKKINPNIHDELERITTKALAKDRSLRYQTAAELYRDLSRYLYKVNPEFTPHELSLFIKTLFKEDIVEDRKKVQEFAKINFPKYEKKEEKTWALGEATKTLTESKTGNPDELLSLSKTAEPNLDFSLKINRVELARKALPPKSPNLAGRPNNTTRTGVGPLTMYTSGGYSRSTGTIKKSSWLKLPPMSVNVFVLTFVVVTYYFLKNPEQILSAGSQLLESIKPKSTTTAVEAGPPIPPPVDVPRGRVFVHSVPAGAQIFIDLKLVGMTPAEITVPLNKKINITLKKESYLPYIKDFVAAKNLEDFGATLQKAVFGYIDVEVRPSNADIYINGQKLPEKSPVKRFPALANTKVTIVATDPATNMTDRKTVFVKQDRVEDVKLYLKKSK